MGRSGRGPGRTTRARRATSAPPPPPPARRPAPLRLPPLRALDRTHPPQRVDQGRVRRGDPGQGAGRGETDRHLRPLDSPAVRRRVLLALLATAAVAASSSAATKFSLTSPAFKNGGSYPNVFSCIGANETPPLAWTAPPKVRDKRKQKLVDPTKSFAIVLDD